MGFLQHVLSYFSEPKEAVVRDNTGFDIGVIKPVQPSIPVEETPDVEEQQPVVPTTLIDEDGNEVTIEPLPEDTMSRYLTVMQSPLLKQERHFEFNCPYCELAESGHPYKASDMADLISHCVSEHQNSAVETKTAIFLLQYLKMKKVL